MQMNLKRDSFDDTWLWREDRNCSIKGLKEDALSKEGANRMQWEQQRQHRQDTKPTQLVPWLEGSEEEACRTAKLLQKDVPHMGEEIIRGGRELRKQVMSLIWISSTLGPLESYFADEWISKGKPVHLKRFRMLAVHLLGHPAVYAHILPAANFIKTRIFLILCNEIGVTKNCLYYSEMQSLSCSVVVKRVVKIKICCIFIFYKKTNILNLLTFSLLKHFLPSHDRRPSTIGFPPALLPSFLSLPPWSAPILLIP